MRLSELIVHLQEMAEENPDVDPEVRLATQPTWPFETTIGNVAKTDPISDFYEEYGPKPKTGPEKMKRWSTEKYAASLKEPVVYIMEGTQLGYLPSDAVRCLEH